jgi:hypothetical protein
MIKDLLRNTFRKSQGRKNYFSKIMEENQNWTVLDYVHKFLKTNRNPDWRVMDQDKDMSLFYCTFCDKTTSDLHEFKTHLNEKHNKARYCHACD